MNKHSSQKERLVITILNYILFAGIFFIVILFPDSSKLRLLYAVIAWSILLFIIFSFFQYFSQWYFGTEKVTLSIADKFEYTEPPGAYTGETDWLVAVGNTGEKIYLESDTYGEIQIGKTYSFICKGALYNNRCNLE